MWSEHVDDPVSCVGEEEGPVETENHYSQKDGNNHLVHRLYGRHAPQNRESSSKYRHAMECNGPVRILLCVEAKRLADVALATVFYLLANHSMFHLLS